MLDQSRRRRGSVHGNPALRIDANGQQTMRVENPLDFLDRARLVRHVRGRVHLLPVAITQRLAQIGHGVNQPAYLCDEWLCLNRGEQPSPQRMG